LLPIGWRIVQILRQRQRKTTNKVPTTFSAIPVQGSSKSTFINEQLYSTCDKWEDKNKHLSQRKLALTAIIELSLKIIGAI
jgi:hypothetical protein